MGQRLTPTCQVCSEKGPCIVLSVEPTLLYLLGDHDDPVAAWKKLCDHFQRKLGPTNWS